MNKVLIVIMFILLGTSLIIISNSNKGVENSYIIEYHQNKNLALLDISEAIEISVGVYRIKDEYGLTVDYNIHSGTLNINGTSTTSNFILILLEQSINVNELTFTSYYQSGYVRIDAAQFVIQTKNNNIIPFQILLNYTSSMTMSINDEIKIVGFYYNNNETFDNYTIKLQLEKGSQATSYVVPKLIPVYKDNLTIDEKQEIGFGAFAGFTEIIRNINGFIKPIGNFINGILSWF